MTQFELEQSRARRNARILHTKTNIRNTNKIFISSYKNEDNEVRYSFRVNEMDNRIQNLDVVGAVFLLIELSSNSTFKTEGGLNLTSAKPNISWPSKYKLRTWYYLFLRMSRNIGRFAIESGKADKLIESFKNLFNERGENEVH